MTEAKALIIGSVIGVVASIGAAFTTHYFDTRRISNGLKAALSGEISAILTLVRINGYVAALKATIVDLQKGNTHSVKISVERDYRQVYEANLENLGVIGAAAKDVVLFYMLMASALEDNATITETITELNSLVNPSLDRLAHEHNTLLTMHQSLLAKIIALEEKGKFTLFLLDTAPFSAKVWRLIKQITFEILKKLKVN